MSFSQVLHSFRRHTPQEISLTEQVKNAERSIYGQQALVSARIVLLGDTLNNSLRQQLTSPGTLLWAAGFGFFAGELSRPKPARQQQEAEHGDEEHAPGILGTLLKYVAIARSLAPALSLIWSQHMPLHAAQKPGEARQDEPGQDEASDPTQTTEVETDPPAPAPVRGS